MRSNEVPRTYLKSSRLPPATAAELALLGGVGALLGPFYWLLARWRKGSGLQVRWDCARLALRLLLQRRSLIDKKTAFLLLLYPLDSTRYFELDYALRVLHALSAGKHLDISSPRLLFLLLLLRNPGWRADLINPDKADLAQTEKYLRTLGLLERCHLYGCLVGDAPFAPGSYDLITSMSVVEHITDDKQAIQRLWELLKPGGRLFITVPCAAKAFEQYIDTDEYRLGRTGENGHYFWQRFYDSTLLSERVFSITGQPCRTRIYGERVQGSFARMAERKRNDRYYPFWREPYMMAQEYTYFESLEELPGEGVIAMEFIKP